MRQLATFTENRRRAALSSLTDEQYRDVVNVLAGMPNLTLSYHCTVLDDEDPSIWPLSMVTVTVHLTRRPLLSPNRQQPGCGSSRGSAAGGAAVVDASTDLRFADRDASWYLSGGGNGFDDLAAGRFNNMEEEDEGMEVSGVVGGGEVILIQEWIRLCRQIDAFIIYTLRHDACCLIVGKNERKRIGS